MASELLVGQKSIPASADLTTKQFYFMRIDTNGQLATAASGGLASGILQDTPNAQGQPGMICGPGSISKLVAGGSVAKGDSIESDSTGKGITAVTGGQIMATAIDSAASGEIFRVVFQYQGKR